MDISVFGIGYVGVVSASCLSADGHFVVAVDTNQFKVDAINQGISPIVEPEVAELIRAGVDGGKLRATTRADDAIMNSQLTMICVGTPSLANGNLDLKYIIRICEDIGRLLRDKTDFHTVVIRSTMLPGSMNDVVIPLLESCSGKKAGRGFGVAIYPEFLREGSAIRDYYEPGMIVFGVDDAAATEGILREITNRLPGKVHITDLRTAEAIKYTNNAWHATKIVFANEIGMFCGQLGIDSHKVMGIVCSDTRLNISPTYLRPGFAYGGSCLPKDLRALHYKAKSIDLSLPMIEALSLSNELQIRHVVDMVQAAGNRKVGLIGLSFKSNTDDMRESPAVALAEILFGKGYELRIFDRNVSFSKLMGSNLAFIQDRIPHLSGLLTENLEALVAHGDTLVIMHADLGGATFPRLRPDQRVIDVVRLATAAEAGGQYTGLCW
ncbi:GDP-mannose 6-dehydrogenase [Gammaproteobacteria bacterium]